MSSNSIKKHLVVFTGAGMSAESGLKTFRDSDGLWENHRVKDVATPEAWQRNPALVLKFYNDRREQVRSAKPNDAHLALSELEKKFRVSIITQNIDNLHERAGSSFVLHLHGEIMKARSTITDKTYDIKTDIQLGDKCEGNSQLRPAIVWFGEAVPSFVKAQTIVKQADILLVVGTSLSVYPAAYLVQEVTEKTPVYLVEPNAEQIDSISDAIIIRKKAVEGVRELANQWLQNN